MLGKNKKKNDKVRFLLSAVQFESSTGIVPINSFRAMFRPSKLVNRPISVGIVPLTWFSSTSTAFSWSANLMSELIVPVNEFTRKPNPSRFVKPKTWFGKGPLNLLADMSNDAEDGN